MNVIDLRPYRFYQPNVLGGLNAPFLLKDGSKNPNSTVITDNLPFEPYDVLNAPNGRKITFGNGGLALSFQPFIENTFVDFELDTVKHEIGSMNEDFAMRYTKAGVETSGMFLGDNTARLNSDKGTTASYVKGYTEHENTYSYFGFGNSDYIEAIAGEVNVYGAEFGIKSTEIGFFSAEPITKPAVAGAKAGNVALTNLLIELANLGLITNSTT